MKTTAVSGTLLLLTLLSTNALADNTPDATTDVKVSSDWPETQLIRHLGTSYGSGYVGGRSATITTVHLERLCRTPCTSALPTEGSYYVDAPGMHARGFQLPAGSKSLDVKVRGASSTPLVLSGVATVLGGVTAMTGGILWGVFGASDNMDGTPRDTSTFQTVTLIGGAVMVAGIVGLVLLPRTHVETTDGTRLDAKASPAPKTRFTGNGFVF